MLSEKLNLTEEELFERVKKIDLQDGRLDGKIRKDVKQCSNCGRVMSPRHNRCIWCGTEKLSKTYFEEV